MSAIVIRLTEGLKLITIADISNFRKSYDSTKIIPVTEFSNVLTRALRKEELSDDNALLVIDPYSAIDTKLRDIGFEDDYTGCLVRAIRGTHLDTRYLRNIEESIPKEIGEHYKETLELIRKFDPTYGYDLATIMEKNMPPSFCSPGNRGIGGVAV